MSAWRNFWGAKVSRKNKRKELLKKVVQKNCKIWCIIGQTERSCNRHVYTTRTSDSTKQLFYTSIPGGAQLAAMYNNILTRLKNI